MGLLDGMLGNASKVDNASVQEEFAKLLAPGEKVEHAYKLIRDLGVEMLVIDEVQHLANKRIKMSATGDQIVFGVVDEVFVLANSAKIAGSLAKDGTKAVPGAKGALVMNVDAEQIAKEALKQVESTDIDLGDEIEKATKGKLDAGPLDELIGSFEATTEGLSGSFSVTIDSKK